MYNDFFVMSIKECIEKTLVLVLKGLLFTGNAVNASHSAGVFRRSHTKTDTPS